MYTLIIDGNYFAQRQLHGMKLKFIENPEKDRQELIEGLSEALASEIRFLGSCVDNVIICRDYSSWRKDEKPVIAKEILEDLGGGENYKENRDDKEYDYDIDLFFEAFDHWNAKIESELGVATIKFKKAEADDGVYVVSRILNSKGIKTLMWSSDSDYPQMVTEDNHYIRFPKKILQRHQSLKKPKTKSLESVFEQEAPDRSDMILSKFGEKEQGFINPYEELFVKVVYGDKKDNVFPLFQWKSKTGTRNYKPSVSYIKKALADLEMTFEDLTIDHLYNEEFIKPFIESLLVKTKQTRDVDETLKIWKWNVRAKHLSKLQIPKPIMAGIIKCWKDKSEMRADIESLSQKSKILDKLNVTEKGSYFEGIDLNEL